MIGATKDSIQARKYFLTVKTYRYLKHRSVRDSLSVLGELHFVAELAATIVASGANSGVRLYRQNSPRGVLGVPMPENIFRIFSCIGTVITSAVYFTHFICFRRFMRITA